MIRLAWFCVFFAFLGQVTGAWAALGREGACLACSGCAGEDGVDDPTDAASRDHVEAAGADDDDPGCPPTCTDCLCGAVPALVLPRPSLGPPRFVWPEALVELAPKLDPARPPSPDPREISRVPWTSPEA